MFYCVILIKSNILPSFSHGYDRPTGSTACSCPVSSDNVTKLPNRFTRWSPENYFAYFDNVNQLFIFNLFCLITSHNAHTAYCCSPRVLGKTLHQQPFDTTLSPATRFSPRSAHQFFVRFVTLTFSPYPGRHPPGPPSSRSQRICCKHYPAKGKFLSFLRYLCGRSTPRFIITVTQRNHHHFIMACQDSYILFQACRLSSCRFPFFVLLAVVTTRTIVVKSPRETRNANLFREILRKDLSTSRSSFPLQLL